MNLGSSELLILLIVVVVVFGAGWLPKAARNLGKAKVELDQAQRQLEATKKQVVEATGLDKAEASLRKANRTLNQSPKRLIADAASGALKPTPSEPTTETIAEEAVTEEVAQQLEDGSINVNWSPDD